MSLPPETPYTKRSVILTGHYLWTWDATWRSHGTVDWLLIYTVGGMGRFGYNGGEIVAKAGDVVLFRPGTLHDYGKSPPSPMWEIVWAHFDPRPDWLEWLAWPGVAPGLLHLHFAEPDAQAAMSELIGKVHGQAIGTHRRREAFAMNALEEVLLCCDERNPGADKSGIDPRVRRVMDQIRSQMKAPLSREALAELSGLSVSRLSHLFREQVGQSLQQYQEFQRLHRAQQLLEYSPLTVQAIADEVGYENPFYFTLRFKRHTGLSPRQYRQNQPGFPRIREEE